MFLNVETTEMSLSEVIEQEIMFDDEPTDKKDAAMENLYSQSMPEEKQVIDSFLMHLTGWSFETLQNKRNKFHD